MLNYAEFDLDRHLTYGHRAQNTPVKPPQVVSGWCRFMCRTYQIKSWQCQLSSQILGWPFLTQVKMSLRKRMHSHAPLLTLKTLFSFAQVNHLASPRASVPGFKDRMLIKIFPFDQQSTSTWHPRSIFLTPPLSHADRPKKTFERASEPSQSYRGIYEQTNFNQCNARRRGLGNFCGEWYS